ncbi:protein sidekick-2 [Cheilinus undulatus]|uniref:protein sidekick-2 n=1 Tax=Cheilinus undulatus TaxID=241271 RepID=UPI001BD5E72C|nr:protein sidekick-2 [Cheilinus undulatus]
MTVEVFENSESTNCTKAVFSASPRSILRCDPPYNASFSRYSGRLAVDVSWGLKDKSGIMYYSVRYKPRSSLLWNQQVEQCKNGVNCELESLTSSLDYNVQIRCVTNQKCSQCVWSDIYTVPAELTTGPIILNLNDTDVPNRKGQRQLSLQWMFPANETYDGYHVTIQKASGEEPRERLTVFQPQIRLILSYSEYNINVSTFNNISISPAVSQTIPQREDEPSMDDLKLNVTVHSNTSLTIYWKDNLIREYVCYSVEWMRKGHKPSHMSFYRNEDNHRTITTLPEPLEPCKRYSITLHTRPNKDTCNMKHINNSESTYGRTQFYFKEGTPIKAPTNISSYNVTLHSAVLQWSPIPEEDIRGFLLGYIICYTEYQYTGPRVERNITVDPDLNTYELEDLQSGTAYKVQVSGFTKAGEGVLSSEILFKTNNDIEYFHLGSVIAVFAVLVIVLMFGSQVIKRVKQLLWPSIPNPRKSSAVKEIGPRELELLESISTLKVEEWDTNSFQIVKKEDVMPTPTLASALPLLHALEDDDNQRERSCDWISSDTEEETEDTGPDLTTQTISDIPRTDLQSSTFAFQSGYTTMEMFQQVMPQEVPVTALVTQTMGRETEEKDLSMVKSRLDYTRQFSTDTTSENQGMTRVL